MCIRVYELCVVFFFKQKTAYEMRISDWSSDVCSSDLWRNDPRGERGGDRADDEEQHDRRDDRRQRVRHRLGRGRLHQNRQAEIEEVEAEIGRASCRERVCQYV